MAPEFVPDEIKSGLSHVDPLAAVAALNFTPVSGPVPRRNLAKGAYRHRRKQFDTGTG
jgi:hypothetical protein